MSKADEFNKAWDMGMQGDFSLVDALYHPDYITVDHQTGDHIDIEADKELINQVKDMVTIGPCRVILKVRTFYVSIDTYASLRKNPIQWCHYSHHLPREQNFSSGKLSTNPELRPFQ